MLSSPCGAGRSLCNLASRTGRRRRVEREARKLLPDAEAFDHALVTLEVASLEVIEQAPTLPHEHEQPAAGMVVLAVQLEVFRQVPAAAFEESDLVIRLPVFRYGP